jgi:ribosomal protein S18 acetylase RimI-like enzyme
MAAVNLEQWNRRAVIWHLYVSPEWRGRGVGRALIDDIVVYARDNNARCLWLETNNLNYPGIQFYTRLGFRWCGLDETLYDPQGEASGEIALYFASSMS